MELHDQQIPCTGKYNYLRFNLLHSLSLLSCCLRSVEGSTTRSLSVTGYGTAVEHIIVGTNGHNYQKLKHTHTHTQSSSITYAKESKSWQASRLYLKAGQKDFAFSAPPLPPAAGTCLNMLQFLQPRLE